MAAEEKGIVNDTQPTEPVTDMSPDETKTETKKTNRSRGVCRCWRSLEAIVASASFATKPKSGSSVAISIPYFADLSMFGMQIRKMLA